MSSTPPLTHFALVLYPPFFLLLQLLAGRFPIKNDLITLSCFLCCFLCFCFLFCSFERLFVFPKKWVNSKQPKYQSEPSPSSFRDSSTFGQDLLLTLIPHPQKMIQVRSVGRKKKKKEEEKKKEKEVRIEMMSTKEVSGERQPPRLQWKPGCQSLMAQSLFLCPGPFLPRQCQIPLVAHSLQPSPLA